MAGTSAAKHGTVTGPVRGRSTVCVLACCRRTGPCVNGVAFRTSQAAVRFSARTTPTLDPLAPVRTARPTFHRFASPRPICCLQRSRCLSCIAVRIGTASTDLKRARRSDKQRGKGRVRQWTNSGARRRTNNRQTAGFKVGQTARRGTGQTAERRGKTNSKPPTCNDPSTTQQNDGTNSEAVRQDKQHYEPPNINGGARQTPTSTARQRPKQTAGQTAWWRFANGIGVGLRAPRFTRSTTTTHALHLRCVLPWPLRGPFALLRKALAVFA